MCSVCSAAAVPCLFRLDVSDVSDVSLYGANEGHLLWDLDSIVANAPMSSKWFWKAALKFADRSDSNFLLPLHVIR